MIFGIIYCVGVVLCIYPFSMTMLEALPGSRDKFDKSFSIYFGLVGSLFWPLLLAVKLSYHISKKVWLKFINEDNEKRKQYV